MSFIRSHSSYCRRPGVESRGALIKYEIRNKVLNVLNYLRLLRPGPSSFQDLVHLDPVLMARFVFDLFVV